LWKAERYKRNQSWHIYSNFTEFTEGNDENFVKIGTPDWDLTQETGVITQNF
jgi:hypothetical protein